jgi:hypothetical protein
MLAGQKEYRPVTLNILSAPPEWSIQKPSGGTYMMNVYTQLLLNEHISNDEFDFIGVFIDDQLCGIGHIRYDESNDKFLAAFPVYSHTTHGSILTFRLWDASEGREYRFYSEDLVFQSGAEIGNRNNPVIIEPNETFQSIPLQTGWNWISFNVAGTDFSPAQVLKDYNAEPGDIIKGQFGFSEYTQEHGWTGTLNSLRPEAGYRLQSHHGGELTTAGRQANSWSGSTQLAPGWNWIGYLPQKPLAVKDALYFMQAVPGDMIKGKNQSAIFNNNGQWLGTLREMHPGHGYLLFSTANTDLVYPDLKKQVINESGYPEKTDWKLDAYAFESNMTIISLLEFKNTTFGDSSLIVAAFIDGQCRGLTRPLYVAPLERYITFLMIYGTPDEDGGSIEVKVYNPATGIIRSVDEIPVWRSDAHYGNLLEPYMMKVLETDEELIPDQFYLRQNYPNPFNPSTTISYGLPVDEDVKLTIFNLLGQKVAVLVDRRQKAGRYEIIFESNKAKLASGIYFYQIRTNSYAKTFKMLLLK